MSELETKSDDMQKKTNDYAELLRKAAEFDKISEGQNIVVGKAIFEAMKKVYDRACDADEITISRTWFGELMQVYDYYRCVMGGDVAYSSAQIGALFGMSAQKLNKTLEKLGVLHFEKMKKQWIVTAQWLLDCPRVTRTLTFTCTDGHLRHRTHEYWTPRAQRSIVKLLLEEGYEMLTAPKEEKQLEMEEGAHE